MDLLTSAFLFLLIGLTDVISEEPNPIPPGEGASYRLPEITLPPDAHTIPTGAATFVPLPVMG